MKPASVTATISQRIPDMRKSERKVAEFVLGNMEKVINLRIIDLAAEVGVSEPTVIRFCRAVDYSGYQDFKLALAQQLAASPSQGKIAVTGMDTVEEYTRKVFDSTVDTLLDVRDSMDIEALQQAISAICHARRVEFYGFGASSAVAFDAQHKFFRLQLATAAYSDPHLQHMSATSLCEDDVVIAISQSGRTKALLESIEEVKSRGAQVISIAPTASPVATAATITLNIDAHEEIQLYTPLSSRIAHLVVIDVLAIGVAQHKGDQLDHHLQIMQASLESLRTR